MSLPFLQRWQGINVTRSSLFERYRYHRNFQIWVALVAGIVAGQLIPPLLPNVGLYDQSTVAIATTTTASVVKTTMERQRRREIPAVNHVDHVPLRSTSHAGINKHQLLHAFEVHPQLAGVSVGIVFPNQGVGMHAHKTMSEFFFVLQGSGFVRIEYDEDYDNREGDEEEQEIRPGSFIYVYPQRNHSFYVPAAATEPMKLLFFGFSDDESTG